MDTMEEERCISSAEAPAPGGTAAWSQEDMPEVMALAGMEPSCERGMDETWVKEGVLVARRPEGVGCSVNEFVCWNSSKETPSWVLCDCARPLGTCPCRKDEWVEDEYEGDGVCEREECVP